MIGDDGKSRFEIWLSRENRDFIDYLLWKDRAKTRKNAIEKCIGMVRVWMQQNGEYPGPPVAPAEPDAAPKGIGVDLGD